MRKIKVVVFIGSVGLIAGMAFPVFARNIGSYNVTIPAEGSITNGKLLKTGLTEGVNNNTAIGGNKKINTSIRRASNNSDITYGVTMTAGTRAILDYKGGASAYKGVNTTLGLATPLLTVVKVQAQGTWSPDQK